jgi:hypothetical protein
MIDREDFRGCSTPGRVGPPRDVFAHFVCIIDLMLPIPLKSLLKYLRRCSLVNFGKLLERK